MVKNLKTILNVDCEGSNGASWCTEHNAENINTLPSTNSEKIQKKMQKIPKNAYFCKIAQFGRLFMIFFRNRVILVDIVQGQFSYQIFQNHGYQFCFHVLSSS